MLSLLLGDFLPYIVGGIAVIAAFWGYGKKQEIAGRNKERAHRRLQDVKRAGEVKEQVDEVLNHSGGADPVVRLRDQGRLRDGD